jgi:hypothetical protein
MAASVHGYGLAQEMEDARWRTRKCAFLDPIALDTPLPCQVDVWHNHFSGSRVVDLERPFS